MNDETLRGVHWSFWGIGATAPVARVLDSILENADPVSK